MLFGERTLLSAGNSAVGNWNAGLGDPVDVGDIDLDEELSLHEIERARRSRWYALLGMVLELQGESDVAQRSYHRANQIMKQRALRCPNVKLYQGVVADELSDLRSFYVDHGRTEDAELMGQLSADFQSRVAIVKQAEPSDASQ